jgi:DNA-binding NarL/FixJ family response regulator
MQSWTLTATPGRGDPYALVGAIGALGRQAFAAQALAGLTDALDARSWSVYRLRPAAPPTMHLSASCGVPDTTDRCFAIYRDQGLYRRDCSFEAVRAARRPGEVVIVRMGAHEAPSADHRDAIYRRHGMVERLSVAGMEPDGSLLTANLYSHAPGVGFAEGAVERFGGLAATLLALVRRHVEFVAATPQAAADPGLRARLHARCPRLTARELDVLERLLGGMTYDGIAADLGLSVATVKTYRQRAFGRLDMHFRSQLFASVLAPAP